MSKKVLIIEISDMTTRVCEASFGKKKPEIFRTLEFNNPPMSTEDGYVINMTEYKKLLKEKLISEKIKTKNVVFSICSGKIINREVIIPEMKPELILGFIESERDEYFPMDTKSHIFTYNLIEKMKEQKQQKISIYAAPDALVQNMVTIAQDLELKVMSIDYSGNAIYQYLKHSSIGTEETKIYLQVNEKSSQITILSDGKLEVQRNMPFGISTLVGAINDSRFFQDAEMEFKDALNKLRDEQLLYSSYEEAGKDVPETEEERKKIAMRARLTDATRPLIGQLSSVLEYYNTKVNASKRQAAVEAAKAEEDKKRKKAKDATEETPATETTEDAPEITAATRPAEQDVQMTAKIYLGGPGNVVRGLKELIENEFIGIEVVNLSDLPDIQSKKSGKCKSCFAACVGASYGTISFYRESEKKAVSKTLIVSAIGLVVVIAAAAVIILNGKSEFDKAQDRKNSLELQKNTLEAQGIETIEREHNAAMERYNAVVVADNGTFNNNENWNDVLYYLETESVSSMLVSSVTSTAGNLTMNLVVDSKESAAKLIMQLQQIPYFKEVSVTSISETNDEESGRKTVSFSVVCTYRNPNAEEEVEEGAANED